MKTRYKIGIIISTSINILFLLFIISIITYEPPAYCATMWTSADRFPLECEHIDEILSAILVKSFE